MAVRRNVPKPVRLSFVRQRSRLLRPARVDAAPTVDANVTPTTVAGAATLGTLTVVAGAGAVPGTVAGSTNLGTTAAQTGALATPGTVAGAAALGGTAQAGATITPGTVTGAATLGGNLAPALYNVFAGTAGTTITTGNSGTGGNAFGFVQIVTGGSATYTSVSPYKGATSARFSSGTTAGTCYAEWGSAGVGLGGTASNSQHYVRIRIRVPSLPSDTTGIRFCVITDSTGAFQGTWRLNSAGKLQIANGSGVTVVSSTTTVVAGSWYDVGCSVQTYGSGTSGALQMVIYDAAGVVSETVNLTGIDTLLAGGTNRLQVGMVRTIASHTMDVGEVGWNTTGYPFLSIPSPNATVTPATVTGTAAIDTPVIPVSAAVAPSAVTGTATLGTPSASAGAVATPGTVAGTADVSVPTIATAVNATATPATAVGTAAIGTPVASASSRAVPATVAAVGSVGSPVVAASATIAPGTVVSAAAIAAPVPAAGAVSSPAVVAGTATVTTPVVSAAARAVPATVTGAVVLGGTAQSSALAAPVTVAGTATVTAPAISAASQVAPGAVTGTAVLGGTAAAGALVVAATVVATTAIGATAGSGSLAAPATVAGVAVVGATAQAGSLIAPATVTGTAAIGTNLAPALVNTFDGQTNGTTLTVATSATGGNAFGFVQVVAGGAATYTTSAPYRGTSSARFASGATAGTCYAEWGTAGVGLGGTASNSQHYVRLRFRFPTLPADATGVRFCVITDSAGAFQATFRVNNAGKIQIVNSAGTTSVTSTATIVANQWYDVGCSVQSYSSTTGALQLLIYGGTGNVTETLNLTNVDTVVGGGTNRLQVGMVRSIANHVVEIDDVAWSVTAYPSMPSASPDATATPATVTGTVSIGPVAPNIPATVTPATVAGTATLGTTTAAGGAVATPATVTGTAALGGSVFQPAQPSTVAGAATIGVTAAGLERVVSLGNVLTTTLTGLTASTSYVVRVRALDAAANRSAWSASAQFTTAAAGQFVTATPSTVTGSGTVATPTLSTGSIPAATTVTGTAAVSAPTIAAGARPVPATVTGTASVGTPTVSAASRAVPATVTGTTVVGGTATAEIIATPATVTGTVAIGAPALSTASRPSTTTVAGTAIIGTPSAGGSAFVTASAVTGAATIGAPAVRVTTLAGPAGITATVTIAAPTVRNSAAVAPATVSVAVTIGPAVASVSVAVAAPGLTGPVTIAGPTVRAGSIATAGALLGAVVIGAVRIPSNIVAAGTPRVTGESSTATVIGIGSRGALVT